MRNENFKLAFASMVFVASSLIGCNVSPPGGAPVQPITLGSRVDEVNRQQEENAELAKLIVYMHEFEINEQPNVPGITTNEKTESQFEYKPRSRIKGIRLTPDGRDHVRQIAHHLMTGNVTTQSLVVVERSDTSKRWDTKHRYPVHFNDELDRIRRQVVVNALIAFGIADADQMVVVAPAYPTGLNAREAASAFQRSVGGNFNAGGGSFGNSYR